MSIWSRIADAVARLGGTISEVFQKISSGAAAAPEKSLAFTIGMIALGAKMAKADGVVSGAEVTAFKEVFHVPPEDLQHVARVFNLAKRDVAGSFISPRRMAPSMSGNLPISNG
jgi:DnaJ like chaperone protein